jgi:uncharacterized protein YigA (DUF484 family)
MKFFPWFLVPLLAASTVISTLNAIDAHDRFIRATRHLDEAMDLVKKQNDALDLANLSLKRLEDADDHLQLADAKLKAACFGKGE